MSTHPTTTAVLLLLAAWRDAAVEPAPRTTPDAAASTFGRGRGVTASEK